jgi:glutaminyl-peptide cyclotransferase
MFFSSSRYVFALVLALAAGFFGCHTSSKFDGDRSFEYLLAQTAMGPRNPGTPGHAACKAYLLKELSRVADTVLVQDFALEGFPPGLANIIGRYNPESPDRMLLSAHWDTRPWADLDPDTSNRSKAILGANDGASGVAVLLEVARVLSEKRPKRGVDIVFFDAEDSGDAGKPETFCLGSAYYAAHMVRPKPLYGILVDMIGDRDLDIYIERNSFSGAPHVIDLVWEHAKTSESFHRSVKYSVYDDHINLLNAGIPCVVLIDFDYPYWHTMEDTPDKCSAKSLKDVGDVLLSIAYR